MPPTPQLHAMHAGFTKMYEGLSEVLAAVRLCEQATLDWAESSLGDADIAHLAGNPMDAPEAASSATSNNKTDPEKRTVDLATVRAELVRIAKSGQKDTVKKLISSHGGTKLSDVPQDHYPALLKEAKNIV